MSIGTSSSARLFGAAVLVVLLGGRLHVQSSLDTQLLDAVRKGDVVTAQALIKKGANVHVKSEYGIMPIMFAGDNADAAMVKMLLDNGADPDSRDLQIGKTALYLVAYSGSDKTKRKEREQIIDMLLARNAKGSVPLERLIKEQYYDAAERIIRRGGNDPVDLNHAFRVAKAANHAPLIKLLTEVGAKDPGPADAPRSPERLKLLTGVYRAASNQELTITFDGEYSILERPGQRRVTMLASAEDVTLLHSYDSTAAHTDKYVVIDLPPGPVPPRSLTLTDDGQSVVYTRVGEAPSPTTASAAAARPALPRAVPVPAARITEPGAREWPSFRGFQHSGTAQGARPPTVFDVEKNVNVKWKVPLPGFAHSSPIVWGDRVFVTTAASRDGDVTFLRGGAASDAGSSRRAQDTKAQTWRVYALDRLTGKILWERVAHEGEPRTDRHVMQSQADPTPATDGRHLVVWFGSQGLYCYDIDGKLLWKKDMGRHITGLYQYPDYEWTSTTSPVIFKNMVFLQIDQLLKDSFLVALDVRTGEEIWRTPREERASFTTPLLYEGPERTELITAASEFARGYDPNTGKELWRFGKHSSTTVPTPIAGDGLIYLSSGNGYTIQPIYAIRPGATGDFTLEEGEEFNEHVVWSKRRGGPYLPTPVYYGGLLYVCLDNGVLVTYDGLTGERVYQQRLVQGGSFTASGVAADGKLYFPSQDGDIVVVKAGRTFEILSVNKVGDVIFASPAISQDMMFIRTRHHVVAVGESARRTAAR
jgi:outer membrane protein assembly factor BamB